MSARDRWYSTAKRLLDACTATILLVVFSPLLVVAALTILVAMGRPVIHRDQRAGVGGHPFELLKFRTMRPLLAGERIPESDHARITRVGRVLRSTSVDEFPSFFNVVRGDMSLVGPRPLPVRYLARYTPLQARRHDVRPGVTGWAQVNGRNTVGWSEKLELDVWYVDHRSMRLDLRILRMTVAQLFRREGISHGDHATMPEFEAPAGSTLGTGENRRERP